MPLQPLLEEDLHFCARKTAEAVAIYKKYDAFPDGFPRQVYNLRQTAYSHFKESFKVQYPKEPAPNREVLGYYFWAPGVHTVYIYVDKSQNRCWRRFIECKEMFQFVLDREPDRVTDIAQHLVDLIPDQIHLYKPNGASESIAEIGAMEFLFPYAERKRYQGDHSKYPDVAHRYLVPEAQVRDYLSDDYMGILGRFFD